MRTYNPPILDLFSCVVRVKFEKGKSSGINEQISCIRNSGSNSIQLFTDLMDFFSLLFEDDVPLASDTVIGLQMQMQLNEYIVYRHIYSSELNLQVNTTEPLK